MLGGIIRFVFKGDTDDLDKKTESAKKQLKQLGTEFRSGVTESAKWGSAMAAAGAAMTAHIINKNITATAAMKGFSRVANENIEDFSKLAFGARKFGVEQDKLADVLKDTQDRVGDFLNTGGGPMIDFFEKVGKKVGVTAQDFKNLSGSEGMQLYVDSLEKANLAQSEMVFFMETMAGDATTLLPLFTNGGAAAKAFAERAEQLGVALSEIQSEQILAAKNALSDAKEASDGFGLQLTAELAPAVEMIAKKFLEASLEGGSMGDRASSAADMIVRSVAFAMDSVEGLKRVFTVAGQTIALTMMAAKKVVLDFADSIVNGPISAINELLQGLKDVTGVELGSISAGGLGQSIRDEIDLTNRALEEGVKAIKETITEPLPGEAFIGMVEQAREASRQAAEAAAEARKEVEAANDSGEEGGKGAHQKEELKKKLEALRVSYLDEQELLWEKLIKEDAILEEARENKLISEEEFLARRKEINQGYSDQITQIEQDAAIKREAIAKLEAQNKKQVLGDALSSLSTLMNSENRKMFEVGKAAAISQTIISTYSSAQKSYDALASIPYVGPALGAAAAAAAIAGGMGRVQAIRSQSFGSGGSANAGGQSNTQAVNAASTPTNGGQQEDRRIIQVEGITPGSMYSAEQMDSALRQLWESGGGMGRLVMGGN